MRIIRDDLTSAAIVALLAEHLDEMYAITPPGSVHALDLEGLRAADVSFWSIWDGEELLGCGALKLIDRHNGEIKSMRTAHAHRRRGVASTMLSHIIAEAKQRKLTCLNLETGSTPEFAAARALYERYGFTYRGPFGKYVDDPNSVFMTLRI